MSAVLHWVPAIVFGLMGAGWIALVRYHLSAEPLAAEDVERIPGDW